MSRDALQLLVLILVTVVGLIVLAGVGVYIVVDVRRRAKKIKGMAVFLLLSLVMMVVGLVTMFLITTSNLRIVVEALLGMKGG